jgi:hypothetical protein
MGVFSSDGGTQAAAVPPGEAGLGLFHKTPTVDL